MGTKKIKVLHLFSVQQGVPQSTNIALCCSQEHLMKCHLSHWYFSFPYTPTKSKTFPYYLYPCHPHNSYVQQQRAKGGALTHPHAAHMLQWVAKVVVSAGLLCSPRTTHVKGIRGWAGRGECHYLVDLCTAQKFVCFCFIPSFFPFLFFGSFVMMEILNFLKFSNSKLRIRKFRNLKN